MDNKILSKMPENFASTLIEIYHETGHRTSVFNLLIKVINQSINQSN